jgi:hypothetical protein
MALPTSQAAICFPGSVSKEVIPADCIHRKLNPVYLVPTANPYKGEVEMANRKAWIILGITIILAMILGSCATPTAAPVVEVVRETVVSVETVVETVIQTVEVPVEVPAEPTSPQP